MGNTKFYAAKAKYLALKISCMSKVILEKGGLLILMCRCEGLPFCP